MSTRILIVIGFLVVIAALAGCSQTATSQEGEASTSVAGAHDLGQAQRLLLGTLRLEGTDQAVDAQQAAELLVLWKAYRSLGASETVAAAELDAVVDQIEASMSEAQLTTIAAMQLTRADLTAFAQEKGLQAAAQTSASGGAATGGGQGGMMAGGGPGGEFGGAPPAEMLGAMPQSGTGTESTSSASGATLSRVNLALAEALIALLHARA